MYGIHLKTLCLKIFSKVSFMSQKLWIILHLFFECRLQLGTIYEVTFFQLLLSFIYSLDKSSKNECN